MNKIMKVASVAVASLAIVASSVFALPTYAVDCSTGTDGAGKACEGINGIKGNNNGDLIGIIGTILNTVFLVVGIVAVVMIILGGVNYTTSQGDPGKATKAKNTIMYSIIGLVVTLLAFAIVNFVIGALQG